MSFLESAAGCTKLESPIVRASIQGTLTTLSPLHIGDGDVCARVDRTTNRELQVNSIARDADGNPVLPSASVRGALRAAALKRGIAKQQLERLFGTIDGGGQLSVGFGFFSVAPATDSLPPGVGPLYRKSKNWNPKLLTDLLTRTAIDRITAAPKSGSLRTDEIVPIGVQFEIEFGLAAYPDGDGLLESAIRPEDIAMLVETLGKGLKLGARCHDGWGRLEWKLGSVKILREQRLKEWALSEPLRGRPVFEELVLQSRCTQQETSLEFDIELRFEGPFMSIDPHSPERQVPGASKGERPDMVVSLDSNNRALLPASSFRGCFRSQGERILRTVLGDRAMKDGKGKPEPHAIRVHDDIAARLSPIGQFFGHPGWRSPLEFTDFLGIEPAKIHDQHFVAIDRFTGGVAEGPFWVRAAYAPTLKGRLRVDCDRLEQAGVGVWWQPFLAMLLRDLAEGDITFGWGASRGYGRCTATVRRVHGPGSCKTAFDSFLQALDQRGSIAEEAPNWIPPSEWTTSWNELIHKHAAHESNGDLI